MTYCHIILHYNVVVCDSGREFTKGGLVKGGLAIVMD